MKRRISLSLQRSRRVPSHSFLSLSICLIQNKEPSYSSPFCSRLEVDLCTSWNWSCAYSRAVMSIYDQTLKNIQTVDSCARGSLKKSRENFAELSL